mmetsp:Transcript_22192/g.71547  ORF Transcript_22192/g.71547 Transcript_22192/m.71547 type:complete len:348 (+) Transcript_22192:207-1250(+)
MKCVRRGSHPEPAAADEAGEGLLLDGGWPLGGEVARSAAAVAGREEEGVSKIAGIGCGSVGGFEVGEAEGVETADEVRGATVGPRSAAVSLEEGDFDFRSNDADVREEVRHAFEGPALVALDVHLDDRRRQGEVFAVRGLGPGRGREANEVVEPPEGRRPLRLPLRKRAGAHLGIAVVPRVADDGHAALGMIAGGDRQDGDAIRDVECPLVHFERLRQVKQVQIARLDGDDQRLRIRQQQLHRAAAVGRPDVHEEPRAAIRAAPLAVQLHEPRAVDPSLPPLYPVRHVVPRRPKAHRHAAISRGVRVHVAPLLRLIREGPPTSRRPHKRLVLRRRQQLPNVQRHGPP